MKLTGPAVQNGRVFETAALEFWFEAVERLCSESPGSTSDFGQTERLVLVLLTESILEKISLLPLLRVCVFLALEGMLWSAPAVDPLESFQVRRVGMPREGVAAE